MAHWTFVAHGKTHIVSGHGGKWFVLGWPLNVGDKPLSGPHKTRRDAMLHHQKGGES